MPAANFLYSKGDSVMNPYHSHTFSFSFSLSLSLSISLHLYINTRIIHLHSYFLISSEGLCAISWGKPSAESKHFSSGSFFPAQ